MKIKDYELIFDTFIETKNSGISSGVITRKVLDKFIDLLIPKLKIDNPKFDEEKFFKYYHKKLKDL